MACSNNKSPYIFATRSRGYSERAADTAHRRHINYHVRGVPDVPALHARVSRQSVDNPSTVRCWYLEVVPGQWLLCYFQRANFLGS